MPCYMSARKERKRNEIHSTLSACLHRTDSGFCICNKRQLDVGNWRSSRFYIFHHIMTDTELLELAAKAAGYEFDYLSTSKLLHIKDDECECWNWNPLQNDGAALRLAVKLKISPYLFQDGEVIKVFTDPWTYVEEQINDDPYAATRRAIVRASAEIGRTMP